MPKDDLFSQWNRKRPTQDKGYMIWPRPRLLQSGAQFKRWNASSSLPYALPAIMPHCHNAQVPMNHGAAALLNIKWHVTKARLRLMRLFIKYDIAWPETSCWSHTRNKSFRVHMKQCQVVNSLSVSFLPLPNKSKLKMQVTMAVTVTAKVKSPHASSSVTIKQ